ncbi:MAG: alcohol dehydrogenase catalytic domain-containing protein [Peptococcaceae bacterium]|jgi:L-iditol 2-dehydrogenase|nr:alcohol dehydrogenase catalytic domain-containing protein [Peptococcaceae bacterium]NLM21590.1 alcohol dehydrogenase catalytic domain-containing protein [Peptococcaceae bacterium]
MVIKMADVPKTCKAAVLPDYGKPLEIREVTIPEVQDGGILVKVEMAGICGSDLHIMNGNLGIKAPPPFIMGHETIGRIVKLGRGRTHDAAGERLNIGDRITWAHADCYDCYYCDIVRKPMLCEHRIGYGMAPPSELRGGFAEYEYVVPVTKVVKIPDEVTEEEAIGVACAFRSVMAAFEKLNGVGYADTVVIQGAGPIGLYSLLLAREGGAGKTIVIGAPANRLELAKQWGADHVINIDEIKEPAARKEIVMELTNGKGPELVVEASGFPPAFVEGVDMVQKGGRYLVIGLTSPVPVTFTPYALVQKNLQIIGSGGAIIRHFYKALQFIKTHKDRYSFADIVTKKYKLEEINNALADMKAGTQIKPAIDNRNR